jgi:hypothetical protein
VREGIKRLFGPFNILSYSWTKSTHTHLFFQLSGGIGWSRIRDFQIFHKSAVFAFFGLFHISWDAF